MNYKLMGRFFGWISAAMAVFMLPAALLCVADGDGAAARAFLIVMLLCCALTGLLLFLCRRAGSSFRTQEGLFCVGLAWIGLSVLGALPFYLSGAIPSFIDALFESVSGFTTTGASVLSTVETLPRGILYWRSFSNWVGGMGVLVFLLAIVPTGGKHEGFTLHLMRAESPGPDVGKLVPRMRQTAAILYLTYVALTVLNFVFLLFGRMPLFDALCTAFSTAGTGGFSVHTDSLASCSPYIQWVSTVFMLLFGINFSCFYLLLLGKVRSVLRDEELRLYVGLVLAATAAITVNVLSRFASFGEALRHAAFQVSSIITTTGFSTADFTAWPTFSRAILFCLMAIGACAGSTAGGFKCARLLLILKSLRRGIQKTLHPSKVQTVRVSGKPVDERLLSAAGLYLSVYVALLLASFVLVSLDPLVTSLDTSLSACLSCLNNVGPGLAAVNGPYGSYGGFSVLSKLVLILNMLAGRLELFPVLVLFSPRAWRRA